MFRVIGLRIPSRALQGFYKESMSEGSMRVPGSIYLYDIADA